MSKGKSLLGDEMSLSLPPSRIRKILDVDDDIKKCSGAATFVIGFATELFIRYLVEQTQNIAKAERKARRTIQYKDVANAVARVDCLEFLCDVVPRNAQPKNSRFTGVITDKTSVNDNISLQADDKNKDKDEEEISDADKVTDHETNTLTAAMELDDQDVNNASKDSRRDFE